MPEALGHACAMRVCVCAELPALPVRICPGTGIGSGLWEELGSAGRDGRGGDEQVSLTRTPAYNFYAGDPSQVGPKSPLNAPAAERELMGLASAGIGGIVVDATCRWCD